MGTALCPISAWYSKIKKSPNTSLHSLEQPSREVGRCKYMGVAQGLLRSAAPRVPGRSPAQHPAWHPSCSHEEWDTVLLLRFTASPNPRAVKRDDSAVILQQQFGFCTCKWCHLHSWLHLRCYKLCFCPVNQEEVVEILLSIWRAPRSELPRRETSCCPPCESAKGLLGPLPWWEQVAQLELGEHTSVPGIQADVLAWPPPPLPHLPWPTPVLLL